MAFHPLAIRYLWVRSVILNEVKDPTRLVDHTE
jgi:hypothetical protein